MFVKNNSLTEGSEFLTFALTTVAHRSYNIGIGNRYILFPSRNPSDPFNEKDVLRCLLK